MNDHRRHSAEKAAHAVGMGNHKTEERAAPRRYLVTPPVDDPAALVDALSAALQAADVAAVLLRLAPADERTLINQVKALGAVVQSSDTALIIDGHPEIVARSGADGAHLTGIEAFNAALSTLKPQWIAGCGGLASRHDAMVAAEAGADYMMFGEPDAAGRRPGFEAVLERVSWWAEVFQSPCVGFAASLDEVEALRDARADFIALGDLVWGDPRGVAAALAAVTHHLAAPEPVR